VVDLEDNLGEGKGKIIVFLHFGGVGGKNRLGVRGVQIRGSQDKMQLKDSKGDIES